VEENNFAIVIGSTLNTFLFQLEGLLLVRFLIFVLLVSFSQACLAQDLVRYVHSKKHSDFKDKYFIDLLTLILETTKTEFGDYKLQPVAIEMAQERTSKMLEKNEYIDLTWRMTTKDLEQRLQAIYVPLLKGLVGYRIFIIRSENQSLFHNNMTLEKLKTLPVGQGYNWPDSKILKANDFNLVLGYRINLMNMLQKKRFDYFPRALYEPWLEIEHNDELVVEKNIALKYFAPMYFFVNKINKRLALRLNKGFTKLLNSGGFDQFFNRHELISGVLSKVDLGQRKIFELPNPLISDHTQKLLIDKRLWIAEF